MTCRPRPDQMLGLSVCNQYHDQLQAQIWLYLWSSRLLRISKTAYGYAGMCITR